MKKFTRMIKSVTAIFAILFCFNFASCNFVGSGTNGGNGTNDTNNSGSNSGNESGGTVTPSPEKPLVDFNFQLPGEKKVSGDKIIFNVTKSSTNQKNTMLIVKYLRSQIGANEQISFSQMDFEVFVNGEKISVNDSMSFPLDEYGEAFSSGKKDSEGKILDSNYCKEYKEKISLRKTVKTGDKVSVQLKSAVVKSSGSGKIDLSKIDISLIDTDEFAEKEWYTELVADGENYKQLITSVLENDDASINLTAKDFVKELRAGWNLGNTLDAHSGEKNSSVESDWGLKNSGTKQLFVAIKNEGFNVVRIPITWHTHVDDNLKINSVWMAHVKETVDNALSANLKVIINIHHDEAASEDDSTVGVYWPSSSKKNQAKKVIESYWTQIAEIFKDYGDELIFETINEPRHKGKSYEWAGTSSDSGWQDAVSVINELNQTALDTIRKSGKKNANRFVMFTPYVASPYAAYDSSFKIPNDSATNRLILSVHAYSPYAFAMYDKDNDPDHKIFKNDDKYSIDDFINKLDSKFSSKGIPVIIGEYGASNKNNLAEREKWFAYYLNAAHKKGMCPVLWDNGNHTFGDASNDEVGEIFGFMNRSTCEPYFPTLFAAIRNN